MCVATRRAPRLPLGVRRSRGPGVGRSRAGRAEARRVRRRPDRPAACQARVRSLAQSGGEPCRGLEGRDDRVGADGGRRPHRAVGMELRAQPPEMPVHGAAGHPHRAADRSWRSCRRCRPRGADARDRNGSRRSQGMAGRARWPRSRSLAAAIGTRNGRAIRKPQPRLDPRVDQLAQIHDTARYQHAIGQPAELRIRCAWRGSGRARPSDISRRSADRPRYAAGEQRVADPTRVGDRQLAKGVASTAGSLAGRARR